MAEKAKPKPQPSKKQASPQRTGQVALPYARLAHEGTAAARPMWDPIPSLRPPPPALVFPVQSRALATSHQPRRVPEGQEPHEEPGTSRQALAGDPPDGTEPPRRRVRARLTEAGLRQLGRMSKYQRVLEWLDSTFPNRAEPPPGLDEELNEEEESQNSQDSEENENHQENETIESNR